MNNKTAQQTVDRITHSFNNGIIARHEAAEAMLDLIGTVGKGKSSSVHDDAMIKEDIDNLVIMSERFRHDNGVRLSVPKDEEKEGPITMSEIIMDLARVLHGGGLVPRPSLTVDEMRLLGRMCTVAASFGEIDTKPYIIEAIVAMILAAVEVGEGQ